MNHEKTLRALDRIIARMDRQTRRRSRPSLIAPVALAIGLVLADVLLTKIVPMAWETLLPHGLEQASHFRGWPGLVWRLAVYGNTHQGTVQAGILVVSVVGLFIGWCVRPLKLVVWLAAVGVIAMNAGILIVMLRTSMNATADAAGIDLF